MRIGILGPLTVDSTEGEIAIGPAKQRMLLAALALRRNQVVSIDTLLDDLWGDDPPLTAHKNLQGYVSQLRKSLAPTPPDVVELQTRPGGYRLSAPSEAVDADAFEAGLACGRSQLAAGQPAAAAITLRAALAFWRGEPLAEFRFRGDLADELDRLRELRLLALETRLEAEVAAGNSAGTIPELRTLVHEYPLRESLRGTLMLALYRGGRQADALAVYADTREVLVEELGVEPSEALQRLQADILRHDPALEPILGPRNDASPPTPPSPGAPLSSARTPAGTSAGPPTDPGPANHWVPRRRIPRPLTTAAGLVLLATAALGLTNAQGPTSTAAESAVNSVAFIDGATGRMTAQLPLSDSPTAIAADGRDVWAVEPAARAVARVDSAAHAVIQTVPVGNDPSAVVVADGSVWVANHDDGTVSRISPETDQVVQTIQVGTGPLALADGSGSVWVTNGDDRTVTRIDEQSGRVIATIHTNAVGRGIAVAAGAVWVTDEATGRILEVDPTTNTVSGAVSVGNGPTGVTQADGQVWVVNSLDGTVDRIDPTDQAVTLTLDVPGGASSVSGGDGSVWVGSDSASQVSRIDAAHGTITGSTPVTTRPEAVFALPSGVWFSGQAEGQGHRGGRLVVAFGDIDSIDPAVEDLFPDPVTLAYDGLTATRSAGGSAGTQIVPDLAMSIPEPTDDGRTFTFHLRRDLKYSDGTTLQPSDFRLGLERLLLLAPDVAGYFSHVVGAQQCTSSTTCDLTTGVTVSGSSTVTFHLTSQDGRFPEELGLLIPTPAGTPLRDIGTAPIPGTGPYAISEYAPGRLLTFDRNRYFNTADAGRPDGYPDQIVFDLHPDEDAAAAVAAGRADLAQLVTGSPETAQLRLTHPGQVHTEDDQATVSAFLNVTTPPFDDVRVRRALNLAVDRARIVRSVGADLASPTCQILAPTTNGYRAYCPYTADPGSDGRWRAPDLAAARALVRASGTAGEAVTVWTFSDFADPGREVAHALDELGYDVKLHEIADSAAYFRALDAFPGIQVGIIGWYGSPLAIDTFTVLTCGFAKNRASFCNRNIDAQIQRLARAEVSDPAGSIELAAHIDRELTDLAPWVPLFNPEVLVLTSARVGNYQSERADLRIDQLWVQ